MTHVSLGNTLIGPYGFHAIIGVIVALFVGFLYMFNFTSFF